MPGDMLKNDLIVQDISLRRRVEAYGSKTQRASLQYCSLAHKKQALNVAVINLIFILWYKYNLILLITTGIKNS